MTLVIPFNVRTPREMIEPSLENKFAVLLLTQPVVATDRRARLTSTVNAMRALKHSSAPFAIWCALRAVTYSLPSTWAAYLIDTIASSATAIVTNNRGPSQPLYLDGRECTYWVSWAPQRGTIGVTLTVYTYADTMRCSVSADDSCVPEPGRLLKLFTEEIEAMADMAATGL